MVLQHVQEWFLKAARQGHAKAQFQIGNYDKGEGVAQDHKAACQWTLKPRGKHAAAQSNTGVYLDQGKGVERDHDQAWTSRPPNRGTHGRRKQRDAARACAVSSSSR
jgi:hypothetical protein